MEEKYVEFKLESKNDSRIYLKGEVDLNTIDDTDGGDWNYEQNDGTYNNHIPTYWKTNEDLTDKFHEFLDIIDWEDFQQALCDFQNENRTFDCGEYLLNINDSAKMECEIEEPLNFRGDYVVEVIPRFNGEKIDLISYMVEMNEIFDPWDTNGFCLIENGCILFEISKDYYDTDLKEDVLNDVNEEARRIFARSLTRYMGIYSIYGEVMEQCMDNDYDDEWLFKMNLHKDDSEEELNNFLRKEGYIDDEV